MKYTKKYKYDYNININKEWTYKRRGIRINHTI